MITTPIPCGPQFSSFFFLFLTFSFYFNLNSNLLRLDDLLLDQEFHGIPSFSLFMLDLYFVKVGPILYISVIWLWLSCCRNMLSLLTSEPKGTMFFRTQQFTCLYIHVATPFCGVLKAKDSVQPRSKRGWEYENSKGFERRQGGRERFQLWSAGHFLFCFCFFVTRITLPNEPAPSVRASLKSSSLALFWIGFIHRLSKLIFSL